MPLWAEPVDTQAELLLMIFILINCWWTGSADGWEMANGGSTSSDQRLRPVRRCFEGALWPQPWACSLL